MGAAEKTCFKCLSKLPLEAFYKHTRMRDGHLNKCKECTKKDCNAHRLANIEHYRQYDTMRASQPHRMKLRSETVAKYQAAFPSRTKANRAVVRAVQTGKLEKWPCQVCGDPKSVGHHPDYDNPLGVVWLCQVHHKAAHAAT